MQIAIAPCDYNGCGYYRSVIVGYELYRRGHAVAFLASEFSSVAMSSDILMIQRQSSQKALDAVRVAKSRGVRVVMEFDDNFSTVPPHNPNSAHYGTGKPLTVMMEKICREADALIVSTPRLQEEYRRLNENIYLACNALDDAQVGKYETTITGIPKREGQIRIGFAGSDTHRGDFEMILPAITRILNEYPEARMVFVGADMRNYFPFAMRHRTEFAGKTGAGDLSIASEAMRLDSRFSGWVDMVMDDFRMGRNLDPKHSASSNLATHKYYNLIRKSDFDIMIAPIESNTFNACKSYLKCEEAGMHCIPIVASNFSEYRRYQKEAPEQVVLLADDENEWYRRLKALIESQELRARLAKANLAYVKENHLMSKRVTQWERVFESLVKKDDVAA